MADVVFLTDSAKEQMETMLNEHQKNAIRLALKGGGCAGFKYDWTLEDATEAEDEIIELPNGKKVKMDRKSAIALNKKFDSIRKPQDKLKLQKMMNDKKISVVALKRLLGK